MRLDPPDVLARSDLAVEEAAADLEEQYQTLLDESVSEIEENVTTAVDKYLSYAVEQWLKDNEVAIENSLKSEITESFMKGLQGLFTEHYLSVPEEELDILTDMNEKLNVMESNLNSKIDENLELRAAILEATKNEILSDISEGLAATQSAKLKTLAESVEFVDVDSYREKLNTIKEGFIRPSNKTASNILNEEFDEDETKTEVKATGAMAAYMKAISQSAKS